MAVESESSSKTFKILVIAVIVIALGLVFTIYNIAHNASNSKNSLPVSNNSTTSNAAQVPVSNTPASPVNTVLRPTEKIESVVSDCKSQQAASDSASFCSKFRKTNFDGLEMFVTCSSPEVKALTSVTMDCSAYPLDAKKLCSEQNLAADEFVNINGQISTCAEANITK